MDQEHNASDTKGAAAALHEWETDQRAMVRHSPTWTALTAFTAHHQNGHRAARLVHNASRLGRARRRLRASERNQH